MYKIEEFRERERDEYVLIPPNASHVFLGPKTLPSFATFGIISGVAISKSKSIFKRICHR